MISTGLPDLLTSNRLSRDMSRVNQDLTVVAKELSTGRRSDLVAATNGDPSRLYTIERDVSALTLRSQNLALASGRSEVMQAALTSAGEALENIDLRLAGAAEIDDFGSAQRIAAGARSAFETVVQAMNSRFGERMLFSGADASGPALADADAILDEIAARVAAAPDAASVQAAIDDYFFTDPTGFETTGYLGSTSNASAVELAEGERLDYAVRADDDAVRASLAALASVVVGVEGTVPALDQNQTLALYGAAALDGIAARNQLTDVQARLGVAEERIEIATVRIDAERSTLEQALNNIVRRDPYEAATEFQALQAQLEMVFNITARLSSLSLNGFLR